MRAFRPSLFVVPALFGLAAAVLVVLLTVRVGLSWEISLALAVLAALAPVGIRLRGPLRRRRLTRTTFPEPWRDWLKTHATIYRFLESSERERFETDLTWAMDEWTCEGVRSVTVDEELRLSIAAGVATILHGRPDWELPGSKSVVFYPGAFDEDYEIGHGDFSGMAHSQGPILLSAPDARRGWQRNEGRNVVLHEMAHRLDFFQASADGVPSLLDSRSYASWIETMKEETARIQRGQSMLSDYAATGPQELFAVSTESFFERPLTMKRDHPRLYDALSALYNLDPAAWRTATGGQGDGTRILNAE